MADAFDLGLSLHGWIALTLGCLGVLVCNVWLMHLIRRDRHREVISNDEILAGMAAERAARRAALGATNSDQGGVGA